MLSSSDHTAVLVRREERRRPPAHGGHRDSSAVGEHSPRCPRLLRFREPLSEILGRLPVVRDPPQELIQCQHGTLWTAQMHPASIGW